MSKCYVHMSTIDNRLHFEVKMSGSPDLDDPDLQTDSPAEAGSAAQCDAENPAKGEWSPWITYVSATLELALRPGEIPYPCARRQQSRQIR